jgi:DNA/RNA-binding domain of Phe-tRNA-synthetase-like protein
MKSVQLLIAREIAESFPHLRIGAVTFRGISNGPCSAELAASTRAEIARLAERFPTPEAIERLGAVDAWRRAYTQLGINPKRQRPSGEAVLRRALSSKRVPEINALTNAYLLVSLRHGCPIGGYDLERISGDIALRRSPGGETFLGIGATESETTDAGEVVYSDATRVLTRRWNARDCDETKVEVGSTHVSLFIEAPLPELQTSWLEGVLNELAGTVTAWCGGESSVAMLDVRTQEHLALTG